jgi:hypothetical protein
MKFDSIAKSGNRGGEVSEVRTDNKNTHQFIDRVSYQGARELSSPVLKSTFLTI